MYVNRDGACGYKKDANKTQQPAKRLAWEAYFEERLVARLAGRRVQQVFYKTYNPRLQMCGYAWV